MTDDVEVAEDEAAAGDTGAGDAPADERTEGEGPLEAEEPFETEEGHAPAALEAGPAAANPVRDRLLLPILLPLAAIAAVFVYVVNVSRVFLASGSNVSVVVGAIVTVTILAGGATISASPRLRSSTLVLALAGFMVLVMSAGLISLGPSEESAKGGGGGFKQPTGPPVATLEVDALPSLSFQAKEFTLPPGVIQVNYVDQSGASHTLVFDSPQLSGFQLAVPQGPKTGKVQLKPGSYTIYCTIPGHRQAGMQATVTVG